MKHDLEIRTSRIGESRRDYPRPENFRNRWDEELRYKNLRARVTEWNPTKLKKLVHSIYYI